MNKKPENKIVLTEEDACLINDLIEENCNQIKNIIYNTLGSENRYLAEDAVNEFYLLMCEKIDVLRVHTCPKAWMFVAARHTAQGMIQKYRKDSTCIPLDEISYKVGETDVFEDALYEIWLENKVPEKIIAGLTKRERNVYYKLYIEKKKPKEIAEELGVSANAVRNMNKTIRDKIKETVRRKNFKEFY